jgi:type VI secretion system protein ImpC
MSSAADQSQPNAIADTPAQEVSLLDQIISQGRLARDEEQRKLAKDLIGEFVGQVMAGTMTVSKNTLAMINQRIGQIDALISKQLNAVLHHEDFQKLEASWRGLHYFVYQSETSTSLKIQVLNASKKDLATDMERAPEFDQSALFKKVYTEEFSTFGGAPFGALIGDYEFSRHPQDIALLEKISNVAAAAHAPFITAASPQLFNWEDYTELTGPRDLSKIFESRDYVKWQSFRNSETRASWASACPTS